MSLLPELEQTRKVIVQFSEKMERLYAECMDDDGKVNLVWLIFWEICKIALRKLHGCELSSLVERKES